MNSLLPITAIEPGSITWAGATWVGNADQDDLAGPIALADSEGFQRARILVWHDGRPRGFIEVPVSDRVVSEASVAAEIADLPELDARPDAGDLPPVTVAVCTRDRPRQLRDVLESLAELDYPNFEVLIVDNDPAGGVTPTVVEEFGDLSVRLVDATGQGLSIARNAALRNATHDIVAFTDDDVIVEKSWLKMLVYGFSRDERVACVCGMVPSAELVTPAQAYFDRRVGWARTCEAALYSLDQPLEGDALFPMRVAHYGTGANFAVRRDALIAIGGFDEGMGIGSPTGGGEDIDIFLRVLLAGHLLAREPSAVVWHRHRRTAAELEQQIHNYGLGLGAWLVKLATRPRTALMVMKRLGPGIRHLRTVTVVDQSDTIDNDPALRGLDQRELKGVLAGPYALLRARSQGRSGTPLKSSTNRVLRAFDFRGGQNWGDPGNNITGGRLAAASAVFGVCGLLGMIRELPTPLLIILVGLMALLGPGCLILSWYAEIPTAARAALVPAVSIATCLLTVTLLIMAGFFNPTVVLAILASACLLGGLARCNFFARQAVAQA